MEQIYVKKEKDNQELIQAEQVEYKVCPVCGYKSIYPYRCEPCLVCGYNDCAM